MLALQRIVAFSAFWSELQHLRSDSEKRLAMEYILLEDTIDYVKKGQILGRVNEYYDRSYQASDEVATEAVKKQMPAQERDQGQRSGSWQMMRDADLKGALLLDVGQHNRQQLSRSGTTNSGMQISLGICSTFVVFLIRSRERSGPFAFGGAATHAG